MVVVGIWWRSNGGRWWRGAREIEYSIWQWWQWSQQKIVGMGWKPWWTAVTVVEAADNNEKGNNDNGGNNDDGGNNNDETTTTTSTALERCAQRWRASEEQKMFEQQSIVLPKMHRFANTSLLHIPANCVTKQYIFVYYLNNGLKKIYCLVYQY